VERAIIKLSGNAHVMAFMPFQCILIVDGDDALVFFRDEDQLRSIFCALLGAISIVDVLGAALLIAHPATHLGFFGRFVFGNGQG
jgi:hypothetical protein